MSVCPAQCANFDMVEVKNDACEIDVRNANVRSIGFYPCNVTLPLPLTAAALTELVAPTTGKPKLVFSNELVNVTLPDPQTEERKISDSRPAEEIVVSRELQFQDRIAVNVTEANQTIFRDYEFWKDKKDYRTQLNVVIAMSDGRLIVPRMKNSAQGMPSSFSVFLNYEAQTSGGAVEFKQGKIRFLGDPLDFVQPDINLNEIPALNGKW